MGLSILGGIFGNQKPTEKTKTATTTSQSPTFTPESGAIMQQLSRLLASRLENPQSPGEVGAIRNRGRAKINQTFDTLGGRIEAQNARRGFGRSGATGSQLTTLQVGRANQMGDLEAQLEEYLNNLKVQERDRTSRDALDFIRLGSGQSQSGTSEGFRESNMAPKALGRGINAGLEDLNFIMALTQLLGGSETGRGF